MKEDQTTGVEGLSALELAQVKTMSESEKILTLSEDTILREYGQHVVYLSRRRRGLTVRTIIGIANGTIQRSSLTR